MMLRLESGGSVKLLSVTGGCRDRGRAVMVPFWTYRGLGAVLFCSLPMVIGVDRQAVQFPENDRSRPAPHR
jgi:hypothetical protein